MAEELERQLILKGVRQNNLKNFDISLPLGRAVVVTGPSGSGKSSLAFETIFAEGQRRYMQSLSTYARQFLEKFKAPLVDKMENIPPTIALQQINPVRNSRATVGTTTEIYDYLRLLYEKIGVEHCSRCNIPKIRMTPDTMLELVITKYFGTTILLGAEPVKDLTAKALPGVISSWMQSGYTRTLLDGVIEPIEGLETRLPKRQKLISLPIILDRIKVDDKDADAFRSRFFESIHNAMSLGAGEALLFVEAGGKWKTAEYLSTQSRCPKCRELSTPKSAISFSFNSPLGACANCKGFGNTLEVDEDLVVPNPNLTVARGAVDPFTKPSLRHWHKKLLEFCKRVKIDADLPYKELSAAHRGLIFNGDKKFKGVRGVFKEMEEERYKMRIRVFISRYQSPFLCQVCQGGRLNPEALKVRVGGKHLSQICDLTLADLLEFLKSLKLNPREEITAKDVLAQVYRRLNYLVHVGLGYLTLARLTKTLSGGEYQRILLGTQLSQGLTDTLYVLDEPSIGLHPKDTQKLLEVLNQLHSLGNTLVLVEHDPEVIEWGEYIVDMGPGSGQLGGKIMFNGDKRHFLLSDGKTSKAVREWREDCRHALLRPLTDQHDDYLEIRGAQGNNLKNIDVKIPLRSLVAITGVSGSGKSTLIVDTLYQALSKVFHGQSDKISKFASMAGFENLSGVELVDQTAIGKSSRSNPITFVKGYDEIRSAFAETPEASAKGLTPGHFSFNVPGGRCDTCEGEGRVKVDMVFLDDIWIPCEVCQEKRFKPNVLRVKYRGKSIDEVLRMTVDEAHTFFRGLTSLRTKLALLSEVGLGYLTLGQPGFSLSGGEAQRLKIARELIGATSRRSATLFILDEPTTGLHFLEINRLIAVLRRLITAGHSVVVIEHNLQLICHADYLIDLGPDGGDGGGSVVAVGTPKQVAQKKLPYTSRYLFDLLYQ